MRISPSFHPRLVALLASTLAFGCSSDDSGANKQNSTEAGTGSGGSSSGDAGTGGKGGSPAGDSGACTTTVAPSADDYGKIQTALENAQSGDTICLSAGNYELARALKLTAAANITFKGTGAKRDDTRLDFSGQSAAEGGVSGSEGILVETDGFTIENLWIENTAGNGVKVHADNSVFRNIKVGWDTVATTNGAYAIYPTGATNTLIEGCEAYGAADAGVYAGQSVHVIARNNDVHDNVLGIEIENTTGGEAYGNKVYNNTCGFLLDLLPNLDKKTQGNYLVHDNEVTNNNLPNFAEPNTLAAVMPQGTGIFVLAASDVEIRNNKIENNDGIGVSIVSFDTVDVATFATGGTPSVPDPATNRFPERVYVHDNTFANNGTKPVGIYDILAPVPPDGGTKVMPYDVAWDGVLSHLADGGLVTPSAAAAGICLGATEQATFVSFAGALLEPAKWTTDVTDHKCTAPIVAPLTP